MEVRGSSHALYFPLKSFAPSKKSSITRHSLSFRDDEGLYLPKRETVGHCHSVEKKQENVKAEPELDKNRGRPPTHLSLTTSLISDASNTALERKTAVR